MATKSLQSMQRFLVSSKKSIKILKDSILEKKALVHLSFKNADKRIGSISIVWLWLAVESRSYNDILQLTSISMVYVFEFSLLSSVDNTVQFYWSLLSTGTTKMCSRIRSKFVKIEETCILDSTASHYPPLINNNNRFYILKIILKIMNMITNDYFGLLKFDWLSTKEDSPRLLKDKNALYEKFLRRFHTHTHTKEKEKKEKKQEKK
ncbi:hypothetical protein MS3_00009909 [Schistosoma haematobium]|uniref:Uncharacterized protein n=1 Tax=Schistosoma haematobium TaxID=6185 RepID=A0A6A5DAP1_SCHHA|nr:hypothetical protein MS3_00009909 [Schistosoma haematobium]KAH9593743.1 hypothetical protein MS3_00009909 [Schistosoma haematobium]